ncbi:hypothetical protein AVEN_194400-1 [Araneus ventricosus]|uniref:Uncharacterized protein n=1 Tax=Araneus ventricosus TaxID=182803 RepID=A0A4Y2A6E9_ARAVE|nr:hypothetical protein AVEN_194400-1 [Araneus ventricosus]
MWFLPVFFLKHCCHKLYRRIELVNQSKPQLFTRVSQVTTGYEWNPRPFVLSPLDKCIRMGSTLPFRGTLVITARASCAVAKEAALPRAYIPSFLQVTFVTVVSRPCNMAEMDKPSRSGITRTDFEEWNTVRPSGQIITKKKHTTTKRR